MTSEKIYAIVGRNISRCRREKKLTQETLANAIRLNRTSVSNIEQGRQKILLHSLYEIANALGIAPSSLLPQKNDLKIVVEKSKEKNYSIPKNLSQNDKAWLNTLITE